MKEKVIKQIEDFRNKSPTQQFKILLPYMAVCFVCVRVVELWRLCEENNIGFIWNLEYIIKAPLYYVQGKDLLYGVLVGILLVKYIKFEHKLHRKNTRMHEEYGSAR